MAFGFGFNKQKVLNSAEKFVQQGKLQNAITEYEKILKADPKDLTVLNTVGDLYSRLGQSDLAVECFKNVGDAYATQGFTVKAIAMYKKLSKLKPSLECVLRLAELYTQQGLFNDARSQYKQVAEEFLRTGELEQATRIFQKILEMDPENVAMRTKLAEVYVRLGKKAEAWRESFPQRSKACARVERLGQPRKSCSACSPSIRAAAKPCCCVAKCYLTREMQRAASNTSKRLPTSTVIPTRCAVCSRLTFRWDACKTPLPSPGNCIRFTMIRKPCSLLLTL